MLKEFIVSLSTIPEDDEIMIKARNIKEAEREAQKIMDMDPVYFEMFIDRVEEVKRRKVKGAHK